LEFFNIEEVLFLAYSAVKQVLLSGRVPGRVLVFMVSDERKYSNRKEERKGRADRIYPHV
jgi:hypothetical protein